MKNNRTAVIALLIGLLAGATGGFVLGRRNSERDLTTLAFINATGRISTSASTLRLIEKEEVGKVARFHEILLRSSVFDAARYNAADMTRASQSVPRLRRSITDAEAYASRHNWTDVTAQLRQIREALPIAPRNGP